MGFHSHGGIQKWLVYNGKSHENGFLGGTLFQETTISANVTRILQSWVLEGLLCENIKGFSKKHDGTLGFKQPNMLEI